MKRIILRGLILSAATALVFAGGRAVVPTPLAANSSRAAHATAAESAGTVVKPPSGAQSPASGAASATTPVSGTTSPASGTATSVPGAMVAPALPPPPPTLNTPVPPPSPKMRASVDSLLKNGSMANRDEDSLAQAEADSGAPPPPTKKGLPFAVKKPSAKDVAAFQMTVLKAVTALEKQDYPKAQKALAHAEPTERLAQVYKAIMMANIFAGERDTVRADSVLQACLEWVGGSTWHSYLLNRRIEIFSGTHPTDSARLMFYSHVIQAPISGQVKLNFLYELLRLQGFSGSPEGYLELLKRIADLAGTDRRLDTLYQTLAPTSPPGQGTWEVQSLLLEMESKLALYPQALARCEAMLKLVPGKPEKQKLHWAYATLLFRSKDFKNAIASYEKFIERYEENPDVILQIAKCYDRLQEPKKAVIWYDRFLEKFPKQDKTSEILWLRAWDLESQGNYVEAIEFYFRQLADFSANKRGDWANFRIGLCQYKAGNYAAALQAFRAVRGQVNSNAYAAGLFWEAKAMDAIKDSAGTIASLKELTGKYPLSFYGHLARQILAARNAWADSLEPWKRFASSTPEGIKSWMKNEMSGFREKLDNDHESSYLGIGKLLQFKLDTLAILTLRTVPAKVKSNPWFLYVYARMFRNRELWRESYKLGLQLSYKISPDRWGEAPKEVLRLIYPRPYEAMVQKWATRRGLDPAFVYALMRQESSFDREIKSGAGAVGLMQLLPVTGRTQAKKEKWLHFDPYSLTEPEINISLGTAYLRELSKEYQDNQYLVLANYNAGPEPAKRWQALLATQSLDLMVEEISYWETRDYVKRVMGNYWTYRVLWNNRVRPAQQTASR